VLCLLIDGSQPQDYTCATHGAHHRYGGASAPPSATAAYAVVLAAGIVKRPEAGRYTDDLDADGGSANGGGGLAVSHGGAHRYLGETRSLSYGRGRAIGRTSRPTTAWGTGGTCDIQTAPHGNTGALATGGYGTALMVRRGYAQARSEGSQARPDPGQGATHAWELAQEASP
jgi:hypothetical protein